MRELLARMTRWFAATVMSRAIVEPARRGPVTGLILCGTLLAVAILTGTTVMIAQLRERALANGERELQNTILLLTRHFDQQFEDSDIAARNIVAQLGISDVSSPEALRNKMSGTEAHDLLISKVSS